MHSSGIADAVNANVKQLRIEVPVDLHRALRVIAAESGCTLATIVRGALVRELGTVRAVDALAAPPVVLKQES